MARNTGGRARAWPPVGGLTPLLLILVLWEIVGDRDSPYFPTPSAWWSAIRELQNSGELMPAVGETLRTFLLALVIAVVIGAAVGAAVGASRSLGRAVGPLFELMRTTPPPVIVPIAVLVVGANWVMMTAVTAFAAVWPVLLNSVAAMRAVPTIRLDAARSLGVPLAGRLFKVVLPSLTPGVVLGLRVAAPIALIVALVVELLSGAGGLGGLLLTSQRTFDAPGVYGLLAVTAIIGLLLNAAVAAFENRMLRNWAEAA